TKPKNTENDRNSAVTRVRKKHQTQTLHKRRAILRYVAQGSSPTAARIRRFQNPYRYPIRFQPLPRIRFRLAVATASAECQRTMPLLFLSWPKSAKWS